MKTHKVIDLLCTEDEDNDVFVGTQKECEDWRTEQGYGYQILPLSKEEIIIHN